MAQRTYTKTETTDAGTPNVGGIINGNFAQLEAVLDPTTGSGNSWFALIAKCLLRTNTVPTDQAKPTWNVAAGKFVARQAYVALTNAASVNVDFAAAAVQRVDIAQNTTLTFSNLVVGAEVELIIVADATPRNLTWPSGPRWLGSGAPASLAATKAGKVRFQSTTALASGVFAEWIVEP